MSGGYSRDVGGGADVCGQSLFGVGRFVSVGGPTCFVGRDALELNYDPVRSNTGQAVRRQKRLSGCDMQVGLPVVKPLTVCVSLWMGGWCPVTTGFRRILCTLPSPGEDSPTSEPGIFAASARPAGTGAQFS